MIAVASGKGGVGKTNIALNVGIELARRGRRAVLLDADFGLANVDILLNIAPLHSVHDLLDEDGSLEELLVRGPHDLRLLCGTSGVARDGRPPAFGRQACARVLGRLRGGCDDLIIDCCAGVTPATATFALASDLLLLTTTPEPTALADAYATLKLLCAQGFAGRVGAVVNMVRSRGEGREVVGRLGRVAARFLGLTVQDLGCVLNDRRVPQAVVGREPFVVRYPRCPASRCIGEICDRLTLPEADPAEPHEIWAQVAGLFL
ncbi:MAG: P-loop NTPase [Phycisphaerae bacterium]